MAEDNSYQFNRNPPNRPQTYPPIQEEIHQELQLLKSQVNYFALSCILPSKYSPLRVVSYPRVFLSGGNSLLTAAFYNLSRVRQFNSYLAPNPIVYIPQLNFHRSHVASNERSRT